MAAAMSSRPVTAIVVGAGNRGSVYAQYALERPDLFKIVGVAEPREFARTSTAKTHGIPAENVFSSWEEVAARPKFADVAIVTTQDQLHRAPAVAFADLGYHLLVEKPLAVNAEDCKAIISAVKKAGVLLCVGHVLRYTPYDALIRKLIPELGRIAQIVHQEPIGHAHFAHSYVRGNWHKESDSSFMLLAKCCHDLDLIRSWAGESVSKISSFGSLLNFKKEHKPIESGSAERCLDCPVKDSCAYSATRIYQEPASKGHFAWPVAPILSVEPSFEAVNAALREGPYGRCAWASDNDVCDNQVVALQFQSGMTATMTTTAYTERQCQRKTQIFGVHGEIEGDGERTVRHYDFRTKTSKTFVADGAPEESSLRGHGGADFYLIRSFVEAVATGDSSKILSGPDETLESHLIVFAAEKARRTGSVVSFESGKAEEMLKADFSW